jgi:hypothetical protein
MFGDLSIDKPGTDYQLVASSANLWSASSDSFNIPATVYCLSSSRHHDSGRRARLESPKTLGR